jgi:hypothetical protein
MPAMAAPRDTSAVTLGASSCWSRDRGTSARGRPGSIMVARPHHLMRARPWPRPGSTRTSHIELVDLAYHRGDQRRPQPCGRGVDLGEMPRSVNRSRCHTCGNKRRAAGGAGVATCGGQIGRRIFTIAWRRAAGTAGVATKRFDPILLTVRRSNEGQPAERALRQPRGRWPHWLFRLVTKGSRRSGRCDRAHQTARSANGLRGGFRAVVATTNFKSGRPPRIGAEKNDPTVWTASRRAGPSWTCAACCCSDSR